MGIRKTSIWVSDALEKMKSTLPEGKTFSGRITEIVERYEAIVKNASMPELTEIEILILSEVYAGSVITPTKIKYLHEEVLDCATGTEEEKEELSSKVKDWTATEKIMYLERYM